MARNRVVAKIADHATAEGRRRTHLRQSVWYPARRIGCPLQLAQYVEAAAKITPSLTLKHVTPHSFRHATAVHLVAAGVDVTVSHWAQADRERFAAAWVAEVPEFTKSTIHVEAGLLLPVWMRLPNESTQVYRLQTTGGERIIGCKVSAARVANVLAADAPSLTLDAAFAALMEGRSVLELAEGLQLRRVQVMSVYRIERSGFNDTMRAASAASGVPMRQLQEAYPSLTREHIELAILYAKATPPRGRPRQARRPTAMSPSRKVLRRRRHEASH